MDKTPERHLFAALAVCTVAAAILLTAIIVLECKC
jgi:hypothetical protein